MLPKAAFGKKKYEQENKFKLERVFLIPGLIYRKKEQKFLFKEQKIIITEKNW